MYSLLIAEDELTTRRGLVNMVKWNELGFQVDGEFSDGQELLDYMKDNMPDVILTDIKMSRVSGLDVAKFVSEKNLPVQVVFLSGYKDFEYAQSAMEYRVLHYLVKPISLPKLREVFTGIRKKLDEQNELQNGLLRQADHYQKLINYQRQQFISEIWTGKVDTAGLADERLMLLNLGKEQTGKLYFIRVTLKKESRYPKFLADYGMAEFQEQILTILGGFDPNLEYYAVEWEKPSKDRILSVLGIFWEKKAAAAFEDGKGVLQSELYDRMGISAEIEVLQEMESPMELLKLKKSSQEKNTEEVSPSAGIEMVMEYIQEHYCEDITLSEIAEKVYLNSVYISRLIKEQTGKNYTDLIMELRIRKAVTLLKTTDMYVYEIAEKVGYHNLKYFYKVFKKVKGKSPNDYRAKKDGTI